MQSMLGYVKAHFNAPLKGHFKTHLETVSDREVIIVEARI